jgi:hypothetical protein
MSGIEQHIVGSEKLTRIYGGWPTFDDAEVIDLHYWRGCVKPGAWDDSDVFPVLTIKIHIWMESAASHHTLATLRFKDVDDFKMEGFNHQNAISQLNISVQERGTLSNGEKMIPFLAVRFHPMFGMSASFRCFHIEVVDAVRCTEEGSGYA